MAVRNLIDGQTIQIDNHESGKEIKWGTAVHLHKRMNKDKYSGAEVLIYIDKDKDLEFRGIVGGAVEKKRITNEIKSAFDDPYIRSMFIKSFYKSLRNILNASNINDEIKRYGLMSQAAKRIIRQFGLNDEIQKHFIDKAKEIFYFNQGDAQDPAILLINCQKNSFTLGFDLENVKDIDR